MTDQTVGSRDTFVAPYMRFRLPGKLRKKVDTMGEYHGQPWSINTLPMGQRRALLLLNPNSRLGTASLSTVVSRLGEFGLALITKESSSTTEIDRIIEQFAPEVDAVIIGGGDGTMQAAAPALRKAGLPFGILPLGTANDLARTLQIPFDLPAACDVIGTGRPHQIDLGRVNGVYFFNVAHIGLAVRVTRRLSSESKARWGKFSYALALADAIRNCRPFSATIRTGDTQERLRSIQISVGNGRHYGGGMTINEAAAIDDKLLHLYSIKPVSCGRLLRLAIAMRKGAWLPPAAIRLYQAPEFTIETAEPMPIQTDGEVTTRTPAQFEVVPNALTVFVPAEYRSPGNVDMI